MKKFLLFIFIGFYSTNIYSQVNTITDLGSKGMELVYNMQYNEAKNIFDEIIKIEPQSGYGYFLKSICYFWLFTDNKQNEKIKNEYESISFKAIDITEEMLEKNEDNIDAMFYLGGIYGNLGRYYALDGSWIKAYWYGKKGKNFLEDVIEKDKNYYDAYVGLGIYHYYADELPKLFKILSFILGIEGDRELGLNELRLAITNSKNTRTEAMIFLGSIYINFEKDFEKALPLFKEIYDKYPGNTDAGLSLGKCYWETGNYDLAKRQYQVLINKFGNDKKYASFYNTYGYMLLEKGFNEEAIEVFKKQVQVIPEQANPYDSLGDGYKKAGKIELAIEEYNKALKIDRDFKASKDKLEELNRRKK